jgi:molecular chaperone DnaK
MMKDAELHAEEDKKRRDLVEAKNNADQLIYSVDKTIKELGDKVDAAEIAKAEEAKEKVKKAVEGEDLEQINAAVEELTQVVQALSVKLYEQAGAQAGQEAPEGAAGDAGPSKDNVVDADYEVVDDKK